MLILSVVLLLYYVYCEPPRIQLYWSSINYQLNKYSNSSVFQTQAFSCTYRSSWKPQKEKCKNFILGVYRHILFAVLNLQSFVPNAVMHDYNCIVFKFFHCIRDCGALFKILLWSPPIFSQIACKLLASWRYKISHKLQGTEVGY